MAKTQRRGFSWWVAFALVAGVAGVAAIIAGAYKAQGPGYDSNLLLEVGAGLLIAALILMLERVLERRIEEAEEAVEEAVAQVEGTSLAVESRLENVEQSVTRIEESFARLDELGDMYARVLNDRMGQVDDLIGDYESLVSPSTLSQLIEHAEAIGAIDPAGIRVRVGNTTKWIRFRRYSPSELLEGVVPSSVDLVLEDVAANEESVIQWRYQAYSEVADAIREALRTTGELDRSFDPKTVFEGLKEAIKVATDAKLGRGGSPMDLDPIKEVPNRQWALTTFGLESLDQRWRVSRDDLFGNRTWAQQLRKQEWVDWDLVTEAFEIVKAQNRPGGSDLWARGRSGRTGGTT